MIPETEKISDDDVAFAKERVNEMATRYHAWDLSDNDALREQAYDRAQGLCEMPGCRKITGWLSGHLAHIKSRGAGGSDVIENVLWSCASCHMASHNCGGKPIRNKREKA